MQPWAFLGICGFILFGLLLSFNQSRLAFQLVALALFFFAGFQVRAWRANQREAAWVGLGRNVGADLVGEPAGLLAGFADNPWQSWPTDSDDIVVEYALRSDGRKTDFHVLEIGFNTISREESVYPFTVTFVIVRMDSALAARHLEQSMLPRSLAAFVGGNYLYLYRPRKWTYPAAKLPLPDIPNVIATATSLAAQLDALAAQRLATT